tara:strand:- start:55 stop:705 length:651 start_codon:yes stop_codon:yes gene_type:complete
MKIFLDTSDVDVIRQHCETGLIDGVTTNPTLMMQAGRDSVEVIKEISSLFTEHASISAEVVGDTAEEMISQAEDYYSISKNITIKVPCTVEGLRACKTLSDKDIPVNVTLIFSLEQAILSAKAGATYVSPFIGRCEDNNIDGIDLIKSIKKVYNMNNISTNILAASIRNVAHIGQAFEAGADIVTLPPSIFEEMYKHDLTDQGIKQFDKDWKKLNS